MSSSPFRTPMPSGPAAGDNPTSSSSTPSAPEMMGQTEGMSTSPGGQSQQESDANRQFVTLVRTIHNDIDTLSRMRPEFAPFARRAKSALTDGMVKAIASQPERAGAGSRQPMPS